ncbi:hydantoinase/oxoprolinase family protein (plasmid) [Agrobacterium radiobacter]|uniref:Hydantoin utilization protein A n=1 Tax=Agrobacterium tumefaciens str. B6 TaxID=1183423 RepID=A0A822VBL7_AGRTU|nr:hydantoinase/oxoprolinase family protein [Agrobacterium tumefaciens]KWT81282.1 methylhydantoinase [Agrobacterium tumefaciens str. B6]MQB27501.1 hydantoinase/oxoprolinase family protein [Agrobacterium tumefaciens]NTA05996.1 hydantoinase/oxoprolinase family protein [Agrobacterium tumefaciens]NTA94993.1 hydantoinase/oxoprolinase family protein [Agrobacterium tumefaciens]NTB13642.1 hydantoinase/oxoprolinase family protein [Agrobacterium tumefaciens]
MAKDGKQIRVGVDIGGTFTDVAMEVGITLHSIKVLTDYSYPENAIVKGIRQVAEVARVELSEIDTIIHGTTLATNALIERRGARTAFITTKGFRDVIEMRTESRFEQYDLNIVLPAPLVPRNERFVIDERIGADGSVLKALDIAEVDALCDRIIAAGYESVAIGFIHSYLNGAHEKVVRERLLAKKPDISVSISSEVSPQMREFQRFNTVCANAFVKPLMASYLNRLVGRLTEEGTRCPVFMIHSGGGIISVESAVEFPVRLLESGPAGGAIFAAHIASSYGLDQVLSYDMGGTTAKICLIEKQTPKTSKTFEVARTWRFKKGSGMPISIPVIEMVEIGAGGGSIATIDSMRQIRVGPHSAGSEPGPACYGRGGANPTVTDADLILGRLDPDEFAGGAMKLDRPASDKAMDTDIASKLATDIATAAYGLSEVVDENMSNAARMHAVENGKELSEFTMIAFGGAAPIHAARLCEKLGISNLLIPPGAGVGSAIGFLRAPFGFESVRSAYSRLSRFEAKAINQTISDLIAEATSFVRSGAPDADPSLECTAYMRYVGQGWEVPVTIEVRDYADADDRHFRELFDEQYEHFFGRVIDGLDVEIVSWSLRATSKVSPPDRIGKTEKAGSAKTSGVRDIFDVLEGSFQNASIVARSDMKAGDWMAGPAVITERETSTIVTASREVIMQADGCLLVRVKQNA